MKYVEKKESELGGETPSADETYTIILRLDKSLKDPLARMAKQQSEVTKSFVSINKLIESLVRKAIYARK